MIPRTYLTMTRKPVIDGVLETCLYTRDLETAKEFYGEILGLPLITEEPSRHIFFRCGQGMLLIFDPTRTTKTAGQVGGVPIPRHGTEGAGHICFRVDDEELLTWRERLESAGVEIEAVVDWPGGGRSIYVRDPAGNSIEFAPARIWHL